MLSSAKATSTCSRPVSLTVRGRRLEVHVEGGNVTYTLQKGDGLTIWHREEEIRLSEGKAVTRAV